MVKKQSVPIVLCNLPLLNPWYITCLDFTMLQLVIHHNKTTHHHPPQSTSFKMKQVVSITFEVILLIFIASIKGCYRDKLRVSKPPESLDVF